MSKLGLATVAFVPREVFSQTERSLETLLARTEEPYELIVVDGGSPPAVRDYLARRARECNFTLLRTESYVTPNQGRNLVLAHVKTKYVVFVDNDVRVSSGWLAPLVDCAEKTGAWVVGPQYFEFEPEEFRLHMFGGLCHVEQDRHGRRTYVERHDFGHCPASSVKEKFQRGETEMIEFHAALVAMEAFRQLGPLDEQMMNTAEHGDLCLCVRKAGHKVYVEPESKVTYVPPKQLTPEDADYFFLRWSETWAQASLNRLNEKWDLSPRARHNSRTLTWVAEHRRYGIARLAPLRKWLGRKLAKIVEKRIIAPLERMHSRRKYPMAKYGQPIRPEVKVVHAPVARRLAA